MIFTPKADLKSVSRRTAKHCKRHIAAAQGSPDLDLSAKAWDNLGGSSM